MMAEASKSKKSTTLSNSSKDAYTLADYLSMPYRSVIQFKGEAGNEAYFAEILELEGCCAEGATPYEAYDSLREEMSAHIQMYINKGLTPPIPKPPKDHTVKVLVRMPASLQQKLAMRAKSEKVSINKVIIDKLSSV